MHRRQSYFSTYLCLFNCQRKNKKIIYANLYRNTINDGDSQTSPLPIFLREWGRLVHRLVDMLQYLETILPLFGLRSEIILVISNRTCAAHSFAFEITRMISDQIVLHPAQLPLYIVQLTYSFIHLSTVFFFFCFLNQQAK